MQGENTFDVGLWKGLEALVLERRRASDDLYVIVRRFFFFFCGLVLGSKINTVSYPQHNNDVSIPGLPVWLKKSCNGSYSSNTVGM